MPLFTPLSLKAVNDQGVELDLELMPFQIRVCYFGVDWFELQEDVFYFMIEGWGKIANEVLVYEPQNC